MRSIAILVMLSLSSFLASGQGKNTIWCFGDSAGIDFRNRLSPVVFQSGINTKGTAASISDSLGNLLFYSGSPDIRYLNNGVLKAIIYNNRHVKCGIMKWLSFPVRKILISIMFFTLA